ncbi:hypothetical protein BDW59DRAFT_168508 [Aspergillus cavernicola]|uniref:Uncharacterized protein n=1 Tax=Aspergillus cavernicola TaxID=176166 RepID=A0ABR4J5E4_9EURO
MSMILPPPFIIVISGWKRLGADVSGRMISAISKHPSLAGNYPLLYNTTKTLSDNLRHLSSTHPRITMSAAATITTSKPSLTTNDSAVLEALFDAESSSSAVAIDPSLPPLPAHLNITPKDLKFLQSREKAIISTLSSSTQPTQETIQSAINAFDELIIAYPTYPSAHANLAQALRMLIEASTTFSSETTPDNNLFTQSNTPTLSALLSSLSQSITLSTPPSPADPVSPLQARLLADTHTHRAYLLLKISRYLKNNRDNVEGVPERLREMRPDGLEEMASQDFFLGGRYGNKVAQQMAVQTNPYAKMCGAIVKEAMREEMGGEGGGFVG